MKIVLITSVLFINWLLGRMMTKRNERGCCAACGNAMHIYSVVQDGFMGRSFGHCVPCSRKIRVVRWLFGLVALGLSVAAIYFSFA
jgi:hypothetical protein